MAARSHDARDPRAPSLLDARATGGVHARDGFAVQDRYLALQVPSWLSDGGFIRFQPERNEDIDVWFEDGLEHHQVKNEDLTEGAVRDLIGEFRVRNAKLIAEGRLRRYVVACPHLSARLRGFAKALSIHRRHHFAPDDDGERQASLGTLAETAARRGLQDHLDFIVGHVHFEQHLAGLEDPCDSVGERLAFRLSGVLGIDQVEEGMAVADALLRALEQDRARAWSRDQLCELLATAVRTYRAGPPRPAGDLILVRHETLKRVDIDPAPDDEVDLFRDRRVVLLSLEAVDRMGTLDTHAMAAVAAELTSAEGPYRKALATPGARILYYGFPHVPLAALAGYVAQAHRLVALAEHDLESGRFRWKPDIGVSLATVRVEQESHGDAARIRLSVSAIVRDEACAEVLPHGRVRVDIHVQAEQIGRGTVATSAQAAEYAARLRRALDRHVTGNPAIMSMHVFAAVPVSVAFRLGQVLAHSGLPRSYVYNFDAAATPRYCWRLGLYEAVEGEHSVEVLGRK